MKTLNYFFLVFWLLVISCATSDLEVITSEDLIRVDREFSSFSQKHGYNKAFIKYAADSAILLRDHHAPYVGSADLLTVFDTTKIESAILQWEPLYAQLAASKDLGFTYGAYKIISPDSADQVIGNGYYASIWERNKDGDWKWKLDVGTTSQE